MTRVLECRVEQDAITENICKKTDFTFNGVIKTEIPDFVKPSEFSIGVIVGPSGSGKTTILNQFGVTPLPTWDNSLSVASHFENADEAFDRLSASGLNSVPSWLKPYNVLSTGEKYRADLARQIANDATIDEFTSTVDRNTAISCAKSLSRYIKRTGLRNVVISTCHRDVVAWLEPEWVFDTQKGDFVSPRGWERERLSIEVVPTDYKLWSRFANHHYLTGSINKSSRCWLATLHGQPIGFASAIAFPNGNFKNAWREHRTVILPDFQGLGIGTRLSDTVAQFFIDEGCRYFSKTSHPVMGRYRENSTKWKPTSKNKKARGDYTLNHKTKEDRHKMQHANRLTFSHEYIGAV